MATILNEEQRPVSGEEVRYFQLMSDLRRCAMYVTGGCMLISVLLWIIETDHELWKRILLSAVFASIAIWMSQFLLPRVKVDRHGISRRILLWWDLWTWEAFADGRIRHADRRSVREYRNPARFWGFHRLRLEILNPADELEVDSLIRKVWTPPPLEPLPESIQIERALFNGRMVKHVELTASHLTVLRKQETSVFQWSDVDKVEIWRSESDRADFMRMFIHIQNDRLNCIQNQDSNYRAPDEIFSNFILAHISAERIHDFAFKGRLRSLEELEFRKAREEKQLREYRNMKWASIMNIPVWGFAAFFVDPETLEVVIMLFTISSLTFIAGYFGRKESKKRLQEYEAERTKFLGNDEAATS